MYIYGRSYFTNVRLVAFKRKLIIPSLDQHFCLIFGNTERQYREGESLKDIMTLLILFCGHRQLATSGRRPSICLSSSVAVECKRGDIENGMQPPVILCSLNEVWSSGSAEDDF